MPEIAEVERARLRIHRQVLNYKIIDMKTQEDNKVFVNEEAKEFKKLMLNKKLVDTKRRGKYFVLLFDKEPHLVAHLGMTGGVRFKHEEEEWPPRFWKFQITFENTETKEKIYFGFKDPRRLAKLRLVKGDPLLSEPISKLGFDPVLDMPSYERFHELVTKRAVPIKALLLDQSFSAGVGNWVADEILYQAKVHPAQYTNTLLDDEIKSIYEKTKYICDTAVSVEADESKFPDDWLMKYRWNKGKGLGKGVLPNGAKLEFHTVGGRTSAIDPTRQILRPVTQATVKAEKKVKGKKEEAVDVKIEDETTATIGDKPVKVRAKRQIKKEEEEEEPKENENGTSKKRVKKEVIRNIKKEIDHPATTRRTRSSTRNLITA